MNDWITLLSTTNVYRLVDVVGVLANGLLGGVVARKMRFDIVGYIALAMFSALGGGALRDILLTTRPVMLTDPAYLGGALAAAFVSYVVTLHGKWLHRFLVFADSLSMGCWAATGVIKGLAFGLAPIPAILMGVVTAVGGGMIRDVCTGHVPAIFGGNTLYASPALLGALEALIFSHFGMPDLGMGVAIFTCCSFALLARRYQWRLPEAREWTLPKTRWKGPRSRFN